MPCPFGFSAENAGEDGDAESEVEGGEEVEGKCVVTEEPTQDEPAAANGETTAAPAPKGKKKSGIAKGFLASGKAAPAKPKKGVCPMGHAAEAEQDGRFDYEKDPISWFYQHQIRSEEDFQKKKVDLREAAKKRLEDIMNRKNKAIEWDSDDEFNWSVASSELSDLDSDVDSISSMISCADSWIVEARYPELGQTCLKYSCVAAVAVLAHVLWTSFTAAKVLGSSFGMPNSSSWLAIATVLLALVAAFGVVTQYYAAQRRSRKVLLGGQCLLLVVYGIAVFLAVASFYQPRQVEDKMKSSACGRYAHTEHGAKMCALIPDIEEEMQKRLLAVAISNALLAVSTLATIVLSTWCLFELCYIEKKAYKHKRRHKRRKKTIPWDKIKIVGPVTTCGA